MKLKQSRSKAVQTQNTAMALKANSRTVLKQSES
jgi:hypothetical protein